MPGPMLGCAPLRWIGVRSYSLYLWHYPIFCVTRPGLDVPLHGWPTARRCASVLSFGAADLSYRYVETPIRGGAIGRYLDRAARRARREPAPGSLRRGVVGRRRVDAHRGRAWVPASPPAQGQTADRSRRRRRDARPRASKGNDANSQTIAALRPRHSATHHDREGHARRPGTRARTGSGRDRRRRTRSPGDHGHDHRTRTRSRTPILAVGDSVMLGAEQSLEARHPRDLRRREGEPAVLGRDRRAAGLQERGAAAADHRRAHGHQRRVQRRAVRPDDGRASGTDRSSS